MTEFSRHLLKTSSGHRISIFHKEPESPRVVVIAPGFFQSKETLTFRRLARDLSGTIDVISMDFRGHGRSEGWYTFSARETEDLKAVLDHARKSYRRVGVLGFSYGGTIAILEQAQFGNIDSLVCVGSPMAASEVEHKWWTPEAIRLGLRGLERGAGVRSGNPWLSKTNAIDVVSASAAPILFIHGSKDPTVGIRHSRLMHEKAAEPKALKIFEGASHAEDIYRSHPREFLEAAKSWFGTTL